MNKKIHNYISLVTNAVIILCTLFCVIKLFFLNGISFADGTVINKESLRYFTVLSNIYLAITSGIIIYYDSQVILGKNIKLPKVFYIIRFTSIIAISITFFVVMFYLVNVFGFKAMLSGANLILHFTNPILACVVFFLTEEKHKLKFIESLYGLLPVFIYGLFYVLFAYITHTWEDFYHFNDAGLAGLFIPLLIVAVFGVSVGYLYLANYLKKKSEDIKEVEVCYEKSIHAVDAYTNKVFRFVILMTASAALIASTTFTLQYLLEVNDQIHKIPLIIFDVCCTGYFILALIFSKKSFDEKGLLKKSRVRLVKFLICILMMVQWNSITYFFPSTDFWGYAFFFIILSAFFFDYRLVDCVSAGIIISIIISWLIIPEKLLGTQYLISNLTLRIVCLALSIISLHIITYFGGVFLVKELEKLAEHDPLTQLYNRRHMDEYIEDKMKLARENKNCFSVAMIDIDDFKDVNDTLGHDCGDYVLKELGTILSSNVRECDRAFRYGGEEFLLVIDGDIILAQKMLESIFNQLRQFNFVYKDFNFKITCTCGICDSLHRRNMKDLIEVADQLLYNGKYNGKNQIVVKKDRQ